MVKTLGISFQLDDLVIEKDMAFGCDYLVITQIERGPFIHDGQETIYDDVLEEDRRPIPGLKEEKIKAWLEKEVGK